ncbi:MAG: hypothetical protein PHR77_08070 [Kiritimatiellae bacterium]|nr:hypothetical protein [Kiritimatiellia bacterium]MDD5521556.1 hypothetical protein [Kiritimatiellia bacterium]
MNREPIYRRRFLQATLAGTVGTILGNAIMSSAEPSKPVKIEEPFHGAVLNKRHGEQSTEGLKIKVTGKAPASSRVVVNGLQARCEGDKFMAEVILKEKETDIVATSESGSGRQEDRVRVVWDKHSQPRYRFSIDDNSFFLRDIFQKKYTSLFDCFYLRSLRDIHAKYGAKFVLNIYYTTGDDFSLPQFPHSYKGEWHDNSNWLKLSFHAHANDPDRPYQDAPPEQLMADFDQVVEQILRFAGEQTYSPPTVIHWGMLRQSALKPLASRGVRVLSGFFARNSKGLYDVNYRIDDARSEYLSHHDALKDFDSGIIFSRVDIVCNNVPIEKIASTLEPVAADPNRAEVMDLFTHEQYFWPFYRRYIPDHAQRLDAAIRFVAERGYKPVFFHEGFLGGQDWGTETKS